MSCGVLIGGFGLSQPTLIDERPNEEQPLYFLNGPTRLDGVEPDEVGGDVARLPWGEAGQLQSVEDGAQPTGFQRCRRGAR